MTTPTPRTDAITKLIRDAINEPDRERQIAMLEGAECGIEQLERDLAAAQEELRHYRAGRVEMQAQINEAEQKAFQAENSAAAAQEALDRKVAEYSLAMADLGQQLREAQEARQAAEARAKRAEERLEWALEPHRPDSINASLVREIQRAEAMAESYRKAVAAIVADYVPIDAVEHFHPWLREIVQPIISKGLAEIDAAIAGEPK